MNNRQSVSVGRFLIMTEGDIKLMQDTQDTYKAAIAEYLDGNADRAIPLLLRLADLEARQQVAMTAWFERAASLGQELVAKADRSELVDFPTVARETGLHSPDRLFDAVRKRDEQERPGAAYVPAKADCVR